MTENLRLTTAQRFQFDAHGYVLLEGVPSEDEVEACRDALYRMKVDPDVEAKGIYRRSKACLTLMGNLVAYDPALLNYATHSKLVPLVEDVVGGTIRLEESEAIINRRDPDDTDEDLASRETHPTGFHRGTTPTWGCYQEEERFHCLFVKTLA